MCLVETNGLCSAHSTCKNT